MPRLAPVTSTDRFVTRRAVHLELLLCHHLLGDLDRPGNNRDPRGRQNPTPACRLHRKSPASLVGVVTLFPERVTRYTGAPSSAHRIRLANAGADARRGDRPPAAVPSSIPAIERAVSERHQRPVAVDTGDRNVGEDVLRRSEVAVARDAGHVLERTPDDDVGEERSVRRPRAHSRSAADGGRPPAARRRPRPCLGGATAARAIRRATRGPRGRVFGHALERHQRLKGPVDLGVGHRRGLAAVPAPASRPA